MCESLCQRWLWLWCGADGGGVVDGAVPGCGVVVAVAAVVVGVWGAERGQGVVTCGAKLYLI